MNVKRTLVLGGIGGAVVVWFAAASTSISRPPAPIATPRSTVIDASSAQLAAEIARLHERLRPTDTPLQSRNLFRYASRPAAARPAHPFPAAPPIETEPVPVPAAAQLKLVGIAEDGGDNPVRTAIVSGFGDLFLVKEGETVADRYRVGKVSAEAVELVDASDNTTVRLILK